MEEKNISKIAREIFDNDIQPKVEGLSLSPEDVLKLYSELTSLCFSPILVDNIEKELGLKKLGL